MDMDLSRCFTLDFVPFSKLLVNEYGFLIKNTLSLYYCCTQPTTHLQTAKNSVVSMS